MPGCDDIGGYSENHLLKTARDVVEKKTKGSVILDGEAEERIPKFSLSELQIGRVLGRGGFCAVSEITKINLDSKFSTEKEDEDNTHNSSLIDEHHIYNIVQDRQFMATHCLRKQKGKDNKKGGGSTNCRYAIKQLQESNRKDPSIFINGVVDLVVEARFLSVVRHPNIIKMRAMAIGDLSKTPMPNFFVVLDRLYDILTTRLVTWKKQMPRGFKKVLDMKGKKAQSFFVERLTVAYDLACALKYLHDLNIVYRDIKPDNIGFDVRGDVKIFDFGLAKEMHSSAKDDSGTYNMTGDTGSPRYMAPEVYLEKPYNETVDVYSFSILLWQILTMETPFKGFTMSMFKKRIFVLKGGIRPTCDEKGWSKELVGLLRTSWGPLANRPSMEQVANILREEINQNSLDAVLIGDSTLDASRKSELSLRNGN